MMGMCKYVSPNSEETEKKTLLIHVLRMKIGTHFVVLYYIITKVISIVDFTN